MTSAKYDIEKKPDRGVALSSHILGEHTRERLSAIVEDGTPSNTKSAYISDLRYFWAWASAIGWSDEPIYPVPVEIVLRFVADHLDGLDKAVDKHLFDCGFKAKLGPHAISTVDRRVSALSTVHRIKCTMNPCHDPQVVTLMSKARKAAARRGYRPAKKKAAVKDVLDQMLSTCGTDRLIDVRDRALILFGWASGGRRRSEIATAVCEDLERVGDDFVYYMGITKTTQEGSGTPVPVSGAAAEALALWLLRSGINHGPLFRPLDRYGNLGSSFMNDRTVARIIKKRAKLAGLDASLYGGHSLRSGFLTEAGIRNINLQVAMQMSLHKTAQVALGYHQAGNVLHNEAANMFDNTLIKSEVK